MLEQYAPELVLVSAGFDAAERDPLAEMHLTPRGYGYMTQRLAEQATKSAGGRIALVLEGGYDLRALESGLGESMAAVFEQRKYDDVASDPDSADVERAARAASAYWKVS